MDKEINLPASTKNLHIMIFKGVTIIDIVFFILALIIATAFGFLLPTSNVIIRIIVSIFSFFMALLLLIPNPRDNNTRTYTYISRAINFIIQKLINGSHINLELEEKKCESNLLSYKIGMDITYVCGIELSTSDLQLLNDTQQAEAIGSFRNILKSSTCFTKICKIEIPWDFNVNVSNLEFFEKKTQNALAKLVASDEHIFLNEVSMDNNITTEKVFVLWFSNSKQKIVTQLNNFQNLPISKKLKYKILNSQKLAKYFDLLTFNLKTVKIFNNKIKTEQKESGFIWNIAKFPKQSNWFWLTNFFNIENCNVVINFSPIEQRQAQKRLNNAIQKVKTNAENYADKFSEKIVANDRLENFENSLTAISDETDTLNDVYIYLFGHGTKNELKSVKSEINSYAQLKGFKINRLKYLQQQALQSLILGVDYLYKNFGIEITCSVFATSFPLPDGTILDEKGMYLGNTSLGKPIIFDFWKKTTDRINSNMCIFGESGSGKSQLLKKVIANTLYRDTKIFVLDPEREYKILTENSDGQWLDVAGGNNNIINPLEINFQNPNISEPYIEQVQTHLAFLEQFFNMLFPKAMDDDELRLFLMTQIQQAYDQLGIVSDLNKGVKPKILTFSRFQKMLSKTSVNTSTEQIMMKRLINLVSTISIGQYAKYWNGETKLKIDQNKILTTFDLNRLVVNSNEKIANIQMFLILRLIDQELVLQRSTNTNKKILICVDEAHLLVDEKNPFALDFLFHTMKRIRKYNGSLVVVTQNINDFTGSSSIKKKFTGIINNCQYWFVGGQQAGDIADLNNIFREAGGLPNEIKNYIATANRGKFWFKNTKEQNLAIQVELLPNEYSYSDQILERVEKTSS